jgi:3-methyl-2-oxobutanoate hydroxymethyltransferase
MGMYHNRPHVEDIRHMKKSGEKISMLFVTTPDKAAAASAAGIHMLSIEGRFFDAEMREAAGKCFVQVGLPYGGWGSFNGHPLATAEDYLRAAFHYNWPSAGTPIIVRPHMKSRRRCATTASRWWVTSD